MKDRLALALLIVVMVVLHQDFWLWKGKTMVFGFLPAGLAYHVCYSILASVVMVFLVRLWWPEHLEDLESEDTHSHER